MQDALLETTIKFHGHLCPGIVTGYRVGLLAVKRLNSGMPLGIQYVVVAENDVCGLDGIQIVTGCTIGNDALIIENRGKQAFRFINKKNGQGMRISLKLPLWTSNEPIMLHEKVKIGTATAQEKDEFFRLRHERGAELLNYNDDELFDVTMIIEHIPGKPRLFPLVICDKCKEQVMLPWTKKEGEHYICSSCQAQEEE